MILFLPRKSLATVLTSSKACLMMIDVPWHDLNAIRLLWWIGTTTLGTFVPVCSQEQVSQLLALDDAPFPLIWKGSKFLEVNIGLKNAVMRKYEEIKAGQRRSWAKQAKQATSNVLQRLSSKLRIDLCDAAGLLSHPCANSLPKNTTTSG